MDKSSQRQPGPSTPVVCHTSKHPAQRDEELTVLVEYVLEDNGQERLARAYSYVLAMFGQDGNDEDEGPGKTGSCRGGQRPITV